MRDMHGDSPPGLPTVTEITDDTIYNPTNWYDLIVLPEPGWVLAEVPDGPVHWSADPGSDR